MEDQIEKNYLPRLADKTLKEYLEVFGAVSVEGPKWCGKTWTSAKAAKSCVFLDDEETFEKASLNMDLVLDGDRPELIDEWTRVPKIWDYVRRKCDETEKKGNYILTCSTKLNLEERKQIFHSGAGRIATLKMYPMSLYESKDSSGEASLMDMYSGKQEDKNTKTPDLIDVARLIVRGGWPSNLKTKNDLIGLVPRGYIESILREDIGNGAAYDTDKMTMLLRSLARNESTTTSNQAILKDVETVGENDERIESRSTVSNYLNILSRLNIIEFQSSYSDNYRSRERVGKTSKRHFVDPSLACAALELTPEKLLDDLHTFGFMFEALVERDLRIYIESLGGHLYHFRDNVTGLEVDSILEFPGGDYAAVEIKLGNNKINEAEETLTRFANNMTKPPKFMCIITSNSTYIAKKDNIYILPITSLKP